MRPLDSKSLLAINTIWIATGESGELPSLNDVVSQFPQSRNVQSVVTDEIDFLTDALQGEAVLEPGSSWFKKLVKPSHWCCWKMWSFRKGNLLMVFTLLHQGERDTELESIMRMMLGCLQIADVPADPPEVFAQRALLLARSKYSLSKIELEDFQLLIDSSRLNLANFYRAYVRQPDQFQSILLPAITTAVQVQGWGEKETSPPLEMVRDRLMPMLYPENAWQEKFPNIVGQPWVAGLVILYVVDEANAYWYVREELLEVWSLTAESLHEIAIDNLQSYFETDPMEMAVATNEHGDPAMLMPGKPDTYNSVRLLSYTFLEKMRGVTRSDLAIGVPGRDFFVAVSMNSPQMVDMIRVRVLSDFQSTDHPLTDRLLLITADGVSELIDEQK